VLAGAAVVIVLAVVGVVLGIALSGGGSPSAQQNVPAFGSLTNALPGAREIHDLLQGIPQRGNVLGSPSAPVTMVEYVDLQCPYCQQLETQAMPDVIANYVRTGKVKLEARIVAFIGPDSVSGREAAIAAGNQNRMFDFMQLLYANQGAENSGWLDNQMITAAAASIPGINVPKLLDDRGSDAVKNRASEFDQAAASDSVRQTPTVLVGRSGGSLKAVTLTSLSSPASIENAIKAALS
jgi:protein-disulfide isomerase